MKYFGFSRKGKAIRSCLISLSITDLQTKTDVTSVVVTGWPVSFTCTARARNWMSWLFKDWALENGFGLRKYPLEWIFSWMFLAAPFQAIRHNTLHVRHRASSEAQYRSSYFRHATRPRLAVVAYRRCRTPYWVTFLRVKQYKKLLDCLTLEDGKAINRDVFINLSTNTFNQRAP